MSDDEMNAFSRDLGRIEGKIDGFLKSMTDAKVCADDHEKRLSDIETWKVRATATMTGVLIVLGALWALFKVALPYAVSLAKN